MRRLAALLLALAACATTRPAGEDNSPSMVGSYVLTRIDNRPVPTYSATEPNVRVERGTLTLGRGGAFVLTLVARTSSQVPPAERSMRGSYTESGETLTVEDCRGTLALTVTLSVTPSEAPETSVVYQAERAGIRLTLHDPQDHRYEFSVR